MQPPKTRKRRACVNCMAIAVAFFAIIGASDYMKVRLHRVKIRGRFGIRCCAMLLYWA